MTGPLLRARACGWLLMAVAPLLCGLGSQAGTTPSPNLPNIVYIMADDLGYGELGCYGQTQIRTPNIDRLAREGMLFTDYYAGCTVCAPSRSVLMTGLHTGHTRVRGNAAPALQTLRDEDVTVAEVLKGRGYRTGITGKWGLGDTLPGGEPGLPERQGFDFFFGYYNQTHAHNYYPPFLFRNGEKVPLANEGDFDHRGSGTASPQGRRVYAHDRILAESLEFIDREKEKPFFLFLSWTLPHANNEATRAAGNGSEVPSVGDYAGFPWPETAKRHAAMITYLDTQVGSIMQKLDAAGLREKTLILFTSDNGPHREGGNDPDFLRASGPFTGIKRSLTEGGIRVPMIARWPGRIAAGSRSDHIAYHGDLMATVGELTGAATPTARDSISFLPTLLRRGEQRRHPYLYWEFYEQGSRQAVRAGKWKAIRQPMFTGPVRLYDLDRDPAEYQDLASRHPEKARELAGMMDAAHTPDPNWKITRPGR